MVSKMRKQLVDSTPSVAAEADVARENRKLRISLVGLFVLISIVFSLSPVITNYDSFPAFPTAVSIVNRQTLSLSAYQHVHQVATSYTVVTQNGHLITYFPWAVALFAVPAVILLDALRIVGGPTPDHVVMTGGHIESLAQMWSASIVTALACTIMALLAYRRLAGSPKMRRLLAVGSGLVLALGTSAWSVASRSLWQHGPAMLLLALGLLAVDGIFPSIGRQPMGSAIWRSFGAGVSLAIAIAVRPTNVIAFALVGAILLWRRRSILAAYVGGGLLVFVPWVVITRINYGTWFQPYDSAGRLGHATSVINALGANLFSPARGLLVFSPICLLAVAGLFIAIRRSVVSELDLISIAAVPGYLIAVSLYSEWWAGNTFGPRYMSEALPFLFVLAIPCVTWIGEVLHTWRSSTEPGPSPWAIVAILVVVVIAGWSVFVNAQGGVLRASTCWNGTPGTAHNVDNDPARVWSWSDPQFTSGVTAISARGLHAAVTGACPGRS